MVVLLSFCEREGKIPNHHVNSEISDTRSVCRNITFGVNRLKLEKHSFIKYSGVLEGYNAVNSEEFLILACLKELLNSGTEVIWTFPECLDELN